MQLAAFGGRWRLGPDSSVYVSLGRNLAGGLGYHTSGWGWSKVHIGLPLLLAANFKLFGPNVFWPVSLVILAMGIATQVFVYRLFAFHGTRAEAVMASLLLGISFTFTQFLYELLTDIPAFLGIAMSLTAFEMLFEQPSSLASQAPGKSPRKRLVWTAILSVGLFLAIIMRPANWALLMAMAAVCFWRYAHRLRYRWKMIAVGGLFIVAVCLMQRRWPFLSEYFMWLERWLHNAVTSAPSGRIPRKSWLHALNLASGKSPLQAYFTSDWGAVVSNVVAVPLLATAFWACRRRALWMIWLAATLLMLLIYPQHQPRYYLPILPFLALGYWRMAGAIGRYSKRWLAAAGLAITLAVWTVPNVWCLGLLACWQHARPFLSHVEYGRYVPFQEMAGIVRDRLPPNSTVISPDSLALEAFAWPRRFVMPIDGELPHDLQPRLRSLAHAGLLYAVDSHGADLNTILKQAGLMEGPSIAVVRRPAWDLPDPPQSWFSTEQPSNLPPLVLRQIQLIAKSGQGVRRSP